MSAPAALAGRPTVRIRGTEYPVLLPTARDPRLHLAAVIITLQVLGQTAFGFELSIAQILVSLLTCAVLEVGIALRRQHVLMWPASALLTGNGVAFVLRVPGTEHGDWWSLHGWWIFAGTAAVALLSKYLIRFRGGHVFNPSNFGLVLCFLLLGPERADPLALWWGPMSAWMALALVVILVGGLAILSRLRLLELAVFFWVAFAAGIAVLAASGHAMTARWHLGPVTGWEFWRVLVFSPEILVFLFFMITDPKTIPRERLGRRLYAVGIALVAVLLIAPQTTEFATKVAVLGALALVCAARPVAEVLAPRLGRLLGARARARRGARARRRGGVRGAGRPRRDPRTHRHGLRERARPRARRAAGGRDRRVEGRLHRARPGDGAPDRRRPRRRPPHRGRGVGQARPGAGRRGGGGPTARRVVAADGRGRERGRRPRLQRRARGADAGARRRAVSAARGRDARRDDGAHHVLRLAARGGAGGRPDRVRADARAGAPGRPLRHRRLARRDAGGRPARGGVRRARASAASASSTWPGTSGSTSATAPSASRPRRIRWR